MDPYSPDVNSSLHQVFLPSSSSLKKDAWQDDSGDAANQQPSAGACSAVLISPPQKIVPPAPAPPPELSRRIWTNSLKCGIRTFQSSGSCVWVSKETAGMWDRLFFEGRGADVTIFTEDGGSFQAHSIVLSSASPVIRNLIKNQKGRKAAGLKIRIAGVPLGAASTFVRLLYSSRYEHADMEKYILHLVVLSHVYIIPFVKEICSQQLEQGLLTAENVVDVLQLARLCDVPRLNLICLRLIINDFKNVARTEGWRVMRESDPSLEQELVEAVIDADSQKQEKTRKREDEKVYGQLGDAMDALVHICRDGCRTIGPYDKSFDGRQPGPCNFPACKGLESLVRHFAGCRVKVSGGCVHCKRMWQLLELHSRMCQHGDSCRVPLCRHFKEKIGQQSRKEENKWKLLVNRVIGAKRLTNTFSLAMVSARLEE